MNIYEEALKFHKEYKGKIEVISRVKVESSEDLSLAYTPGVAEPCREIHKNPEAVYEYTRKWNTVAVISDGTAVLGLGDIGPMASLPVMEGKCVLFKEFANIDAFPIVLSTTNVDEIVNTIVNISPTFGGINLEDIAAPRCFEIEAKLKEKLDIPVFHDDQHGTAIVVLAGLLNALKIVDKSLSDIKVVVNGAGSAGCAITKLLLLSGIKNIVVVDRIGVLNSKAKYSNQAFAEIASLTNPNNEEGDLTSAMRNADVFVGVSAPNIVSKEMISSMSTDAIVFAMANPTPEIFPEDALDAGARIVGTGRSDYPNQINNVLAFPGIFRGVLDARLPEITDEMKVAAAYAIANSISDSELSETYIIPKAFDISVQENVATAIRNFK